MGKGRFDEAVMKQVGKRLRDIRKEKGYQQEKVLFNTKINVGRYERAEANVSLTTLAVLCRYYDVTFEDFFRGVSL